MYRPSKEKERERVGYDKTAFPSLIYGHVIAMALYSSDERKRKKEREREKDKGSIHPARWTLLQVLNAAA